MSYVNLFIHTLLSLSTLLIFDFKPESDIKNWRVVDDVVMGGRSEGSFEINEEGHGVFQGGVSLENNGGFSSVRYRFQEAPLEGHKKIVIRLKGDGKRYQFRVKSNRYDRHSYIAYFQTTGDWQTIEIPLADMYPTFRGVRLNIPNYPGKKMEEVAFLIGNKKAEKFRLEVDWIKVGA